MSHSSRFFKALCPWDIKICMHWSTSMQIEQGVCSGQANRSYLPELSIKGRLALADLFGLANLHKSMKSWSSWLLFFRQDSVFNSFQISGYWFIALPCLVAFSGICLLWPCCYKHFVPSRHPSTLIFTSFIHACFEIPWQTTSNSRLRDLWGYFGA